MNHTTEPHIIKGQRQRRKPHNGLNKKPRTLYIQSNCVIALYLNYTPVTNTKKDNISFIYIYIYTCIYIIITCTYQMSYTCNFSDL